MIRNSHLKKKGISMNLIIFSFSFILICSVFRIKTGPTRNDGSKNYYQQQEEILVHSRAESYWILECFSVDTIATLYARQSTGNFT